MSHGLSLRTRHTIMVPPGRSGGFKQSGIGREGGTEGLLPFLKTETVILDDMPKSAGRVVG